MGFLKLDLSLHINFISKSLLDPTFPNLTKSSFSDSGSGRYFGHFLGYCALESQFKIKELSHLVMDLRRQRQLFIAALVAFSSHGHLGFC